MLEKKVWLPILSVLLIGIGYGLWHSQQVSNQVPIKVYKPVEVEKPAEESSVVVPSEGHFHEDGTWHTEPHQEVETTRAAPPVTGETRENDIQIVGSVELGQVPLYNGKMFHELTPKQRAKLGEEAYRKQFNTPPPPGYIEAAEKEFQRLLKSMDEPKVEVRLVDGFAPSPEQLKKYLELEAESRVALSLGDQFRVDAIQEEIEGLRAEAKGKVPAVWGTYVGEKAKRKMRQTMKEKEEQAYRDLGLGHMVEAGVSGLPVIRPTLPIK